MVSSLFLLWRPGQRKGLHPLHTSGSSTPPPNLGFPHTVLSLHFLISHSFEESNPVTPLSTSSLFDLLAASWPTGLLSAPLASSADPFVL